MRFGSVTVSSILVSGCSELPLRTWSDSYSGPLTTVLASTSEAVTSKWRRDCDLPPALSVFLLALSRAPRRPFARPRPFSTVFCLPLFMVLVAHPPRHCAVRIASLHAARHTTPLPLFRTRRVCCTRAVPRIPSSAVPLLHPRRRPQPLARIPQPCRCCSTRLSHSPVACTVLALQAYD